MGGKRLAFRGFGILALLVAPTLLAACGARPRPIVQHAVAAPAPLATAAEGSDDAEDEPTESADSDDEPTAAAAPSPCPGGMALIASPGDGRRIFCIDRYEASLVEVLADGTERPYPHYLAVDGHDVRAVSEPGVFPQGYISELQAQDACAASGKRLCTHVEWKTACRGPSSTTFPYGDARRPGVCHDMGKSPVAAVFGAAALASSAPRTTGKPSRAKGHGRTTKAGNRDRSAKQSPSKKKRGAPARASSRPANVEASVWTKLNDPALGQVDGALAHTGDHGACVNEWGVYDMVGNLHEWVATDPSRPESLHGTFAGGYYLDTALNGDGCEYRTVAHAHEYHDYSTGFRCCAEPNASVASKTAAK